MPTCPNCGAYVPLGESMCSCGTSFRYDEDEDDDFYSDFQIERRRNENPYKYDFFNQLHHEFAPSDLIDNMYSELINLLDKLDAELDSVSIYKTAAFFKIVKKTQYYDAIMRAHFDMSNASNEIVLDQTAITPDFTKLYQSEEIKKLIKDSQKELDSIFSHFKMALNDYEVIVYAVFEDWGYMIDFDNMELHE